MRDKFLKQTRHEYNPNQRMLALLLMAPLFLVVIPYLFVVLGSKVDQRFQWPPILDAPFNYILGGLLILAGLLFAWWSIYSQFTIGLGTPVPLMATQKLVVQPPYTYCRNPMALGAIGAYLGVAILFHSLGAVLLVLLVGGLLLAYIKRFEEREMELRFGQDYLAYKGQTPFLIPRFWKRR
jgi:protein-S-isoprenylcysteine O-methyltransferase Ste14